MFLEGLHFLLISALHQMSRAFGVPQFFCTKSPAPTLGTHSICKVLANRSLTVTPNQLLVVLRLRSTSCLGRLPA